VGIRRKNHAVESFPLAYLLKEYLMKRLVLLAGAALMGLVGLVAVAPAADSAPLVCIKLSFGTAPPVLELCIPPA
jgi:hypothetical protein